MKYLLLSASFLLIGCVHSASKQHQSVTTPARTSVNQAADATQEASKASQRSSEHIKAFRSDAERIDYKASRALRILDHP